MLYVPLLCHQVAQINPEDNNSDIAYVLLSEE